MLTQLSIRGLAIIEHLDIHFAKGLNVITGETGAGKSILIKALGLLLGSKAHADSIRKGCEQASVVGLFEISHRHPAIQTLKEFDLTSETISANHSIIIRRVINQSGKSSSWINDIPVNLNTLQKIGSYFVDIFGQHENQKILDPTHHLKYIDLFGTSKKDIEEYSHTFDSIQTCLNGIAELLEISKNADRDLDYWNFRLQELEEFSPSKDDYEAQLSITRSSKQMKIKTDLLKQVLEIVDGSNNRENIASKFWSLFKLLEKNASHIDPNWYESLKDSCSQIANLAEELSYKANQAFQIDFNEDSLEIAEQRLSTYQSLFRKLSVHSAEELEEEWIKLKSQIEAFENRNLRLKEWFTTIKNLLPTLSREAQKLHQLREKSFVKLKSRVEKELKDLSMPEAHLELEYKTIPERNLNFDDKLVPESLASDWMAIKSKILPYNQNGQFKYQLLMRSNKGEKFMPLSKIASGGEVSRIMLALKRGVAMDAETCVLVFDEIDSGISGKVADKVGSKLHELGENFQVLCISHLPQVACYADQHFVVEKLATSQGRTESRIRKIDEDESVVELAKLLSGSEVTDSSIAHASQLKSRTLRSSRPQFSN